MHRPMVFRMHLYFPHRQREGAGRETDGNGKDIQSAVRPYSACLGLRGISCVRTTASTECGDEIRMLDGRRSPRDVCSGGRANGREPESRRFEFRSVPGRAEGQRDRDSGAPGWYRSIADNERGANLRYLRTDRLLSASIKAIHRPGARGHTRRDILRSGNAEFRCPDGARPRDSQSVVSTDSRICVRRSHQGSEFEW
jgi:hypothetical protein